MCVCYLAEPNSQVTRDTYAFSRQGEATLSVHSQSTHVDLPSKKGPVWCESKEAVRAGLSRRAEDVEEQRQTAVSGHGCEQVHYNRDVHATSHEQQHAGSGRGNSPHWDDTASHR